MTPVSSLKAPSWEASGSRSEGFERAAVWESAAGGGGGGDWICCWRREEARDSSVGRGVSSVGELGCGIATEVSRLAAFYLSWRVIRSHKVAPQQIDCWYYSNRLLLLPDPIVQRCFSSFVTFELVARWRGNDGFG